MENAGRKQPDKAWTITILGGWIKKTIQEVDFEEIDSTFKFYYHNKAIFQPPKMKIVLTKIVVKALKWILQMKIQNFGT